MIEKTRLPMWILASALSLLLSACDWVDSTGSQGAQAPVTEIFLDDSPVGEAFAVNEGYEARLTASRNTTATAEQTFSWSDAPLEQGNLDVCAAMNGFKPELAAASLSDACTDPARCALEFNQIETADGIAEFSAQIPELKASVGMRYALTVDDTAGRTDTREFNFCLIAINEEPEALDDTYTVLEGSRLVVTTDDDNHLMINDTDDIDVSNSALRILEQPLTPPRFATDFQLDDDGSFVYVPAALDLVDDQIDSFEYELTDGLFTVSATATIRIVVSNRAPVVNGPIPELTAVEGELITENLSLYFRDPDNVDLIFSFEDEDLLPDDGTLSLSTDGILSGIPDEDDIGTHELELVASDGTLDVSTPLVLVVEAAPVVASNSPPVYEEGTVNDQIIPLGLSITPVRPVFEDPDGDELTYSMAGTAVLPAGVTIDDETGVVSGRPRARTWVRGLRIRATDPSGASALSEIFYIRVQ